MSKRIVAVALAIGILATSSAFASRSRNAVLGSGDGGQFLSAGSFFYDDARNIFYNPSYVNDFKNWGIVEKSNFPGATAEGGFVTSISSFNLGVYVNRESSINNLVGNMGSFATGQQRPIEIFFGGDMGNMKWGASVDYSMSSAPNQTDTNLIFHLGAQVADFEPFGWVSAVGDENIATAGATAKYKTYGLGLRYKMGEWTPYGGWRQDQAPQGSNADVWLVGLGRTTKIGEGARMNYSLAFVRRTDLDHSLLPMDVSVEADANSWLTFRGGLSHNIYDRLGGVTSAANTTGRIGTGIHVGKADMDITLGKVGGGAGGLNATGETATVDDAQVFDISNGFFAQTSVSYHW